MRRLLHYDALKGYWQMSEQQELDRIADNEVDMRQTWLDTEAQHIKRARRKSRIITALLIVGCVVTWGAVLLSAVK